ncbi:MAG TPA: cytochrome b/b6 domain-containing protein [Croceibacterium sp.]|nr:cytochrome b/b6 domain-containing protein [Croceibacterium sp.]
MATPSSNEAAQQRYSSVAIALHWLIALALGFQLALGFSMPDDARGFALYQLHKSVGVTIFVLTALRLIWRLTHRPPAPVEGGLQGFLAKSVHALLYAFMILAPLTGWAIVSTDSTGIPTVLYGTVPWPHLPLPGALNEPMEETHEILAWIGIALVVLHVLGALRHQILLRDGLLARIGPAGSAWAAGLLALLVVAVYFGTGMRIANWVVANGGYRPETQDEGTELASVATAPAPATATPTPTDTPTEAATEAGPPPVWSIQRGGRLGFAVGSGDSTINGSFSDWTGSIMFDPEHPETADIRIEVRLASASLGDATQDEMLQGGDFFASGANPTATWRSTSVRQTGPNRYSASGTLTLKGATRPQALTFTLAGSDLKRHVEGRASIDRTAFGVGTGDSAAGLASTVALTFSFDATGRAP